MEKRTVSPIGALQFKLAEKLVFSKIEAALGGRLQYLVYGAAPIAYEIEESFSATGISALGAYGLTETSPGMTSNGADNFKLRAVGIFWADTEIEITPDDEILKVTRKNVMHTYNDLIESMYGG
jgi:long-chain acyl-CoA synthetase